MYFWLIFASLSLAEESPSTKTPSVILSPQEEAVLKKMLKDLPQPKKMPDQNPESAQTREERIEARLLGPQAPPKSVAPVKIKNPTLGSWWRPVLVVFIFCILVLILPFSRIFRSQLNFRRFLSHTPLPGSSEPTTLEASVEDSEEDDEDEDFMVEKPRTTKPGKIFFGSYEILSIHHKYSTSILFRAKHFLPTWANSQNGEVLLHVLQKDSTDAASFLSNFIQHARYGTLPNHPNLVPVLDVVFDQNRIAIVMPMVDGISLERFVPLHGLDIAIVLRILTPLSSLLDQLHSQQTHHKNLRLNRIFIAKDGSPSLLDFGFQEPSNDPLANDYFAFGLLSYQLLSGTTPWPEDATEYEQAAHIAQGTLTPLLEKAPTISEPINQAIMKLLENKPRPFPSFAAYLASWNPPKPPIPEPPPSQPIENPSSSPTEASSSTVNEDNLSSQAIMESFVKDTIQADTVVETQPNRENAEVLSAITSQQNATSTPPPKDFVVTSVELPQSNFSNQSDLLKAEVQEIDDEP